jgi:hypothetical protein
MLQSRVTTAILLASSVLSGMLALAALPGLRLPGDQRGYEPEQPVAFSHRLHAGELEMPCLYCHSGAERSRAAGVPSPALCMNCHRFVPAPLANVRAEEQAAQKEGRKPRLIVSPEIRKIYAAMGLSDELQPDPSRPPRPIEWVRVHDLPDFACFDHRPHVAAGVACQRCHGAVEAMERMRQEESLGMGWCVSCHRESHVPATGKLPDRRPSTDCSACHY